MNVGVTVATPAPPVAAPWCSSGCARRCSGRAAGEPHVDLHRVGDVVPRDERGAGAGRGVGGHLGRTGGGCEERNRYGVDGRRRQQQHSQDGQRHRSSFHAFLPVSGGPGSPARAPHSASDRFGCRECCKPLAILCLQPSHRGRSILVRHCRQTESAPPLCACGHRVGSSPRVVNPVRELDIRCKNRLAYSSNFNSRVSRSRPVGTVSGV